MGLQCTYLIATLFGKNLNVPNSARQANDNYLLSMFKQFLTSLSKARDENTDEVVTDLLHQLVEISEGELLSEKFRNSEKSSGRKNSTNSKTSTNSNQVSESLGTSGSDSVPATEAEDEHTIKERDGRWVAAPFLGVKEEVLSAMCGVVEGFV